MRGFPRGLDSKRLKQFGDTDPLDMHYYGDVVSRTVERRFRTGPSTAEIRASVTGGPAIAGYAAVFNSPSSDMGFIETIDPGAFAKTILEADVRALGNHDVDWLLGRTKSGSLHLSTDSTGLFYSIDVNPADPDGVRAVEKVRRGDMDGSSFSFMFTTSMREFGSEGKHWSPCASTLVTGETEAVLTDTGHIKSDVSALGDMIEQTGKRLTTIYITHGHLDHFLGIGQLMQRSPHVRPVTTPAVLADIKASVADQETQWQRRFGDDVDATAVIPEPLEGNVIDLEGHELRVIEVPQGDIAPSTIIHIPSIATVIGGDVVYNRIHMMLALTGPAQWQKWIDSIDLVESLGATTIIAGHKQPDASDQDLDTILNGSRGYIRDFGDAVAASRTAKEVIGTMTAKYPNYGNLTTLEFSAGAAFPAA